MPHLFNTASGSEGTSPAASMAIRVMLAALKVAEGPLPTNSVPAILSLCDEWVRTLPFDSEKARFGGLGGLRGGRGLELLSCSCGSGYLRRPRPLICAAHLSLRSLISAPPTYLRRPRPG